MSSWHYRIVFHNTDADPDKHYYGLHEVYTDPVGWTENPIQFVCDCDEGKEAIIRALQKALNDAQNRPVLVENDRETWI